MNNNQRQLIHKFSVMLSLKGAIAKIYPPTRSLIEVNRIRWGFSGAFVSFIQKWLEGEAFIPIGLFKTTPVRPRVASTPGFACYACYHPQERIEALVYKLGSTGGFEFVRYNGDSTVTIATTDMRMLTPAITPKFYQRVGPERDFESLKELEDYFTVSQEMLASLRAEPIPDCGCVELNPEDFLQRYESRYARLMKEVNQKIEAFLESTQSTGKRFCLFDFIPKEPMENVIKDRVNQFKDFDYHEKSAVLLIHKISIPFEIMCFKHLEFPRAIDPERYMQQGMDAALDYFFGNWWQEGKRHVRLSDSEKNKELWWFDPFIHGMLFMLLLQQWENLTKLCSWLNADYEIEDTEEKEILIVFKLVASSLSPEPTNGLEDVRESINKLRLKKSKLLLNIWDAIEAKDQKKYEQSMEESLTLYLESVDPYIKKGKIQYCVGELQTVLCLIALKKGLAFPKLPEKLAAALVTRETLGLE